MFEIQISADGRPFRRGDANDSGAFDIADPVSILNHLFAGTAEPTCLDAADTNGDGSLNLVDAVRSLNFLFAGGVPPVEPGPDSCDVSESSPLGCMRYDSC